MKFRTEYIPARGGTIDPGKPTVLLGSCFADNLGERIRRCMWEAENPAGTLFNPLSISSAIEVMLMATGRTGGAQTEAERLRRFEESLFERDGIWLSWLFNSKLHGGSKEEICREFLERSRRLDTLLGKGEVLFVTFGTAWCYWLENDYLVANCHKQPARLFERRRLTQKEIVDKWRGTLDLLQSLYPGLRIVFTVSPVRHLKDGFEGNKRSKALLLLAVEELCESSEAEYFPAYEIVNDDLRDYRFYASDLVHPSEEAVEYLWEIFQATYIDEKGKSRLKEGEAEYKRRNHRPLA